MKHAAGYDSDVSVLTLASVSWIDVFCAVMFCAEHTCGPPRLLKYCSEICFDSDNAKVTSRPGIVASLSVVIPPQSNDAHEVCCSAPSSNVTRRLSSTMQHKVGAPRSHSEFKDGISYVFQEISKS